MTMNRTDTEGLARKILLHSRRRISHIAPVLLEAVYSLPEKVRASPGPLSTDGRYLWFDPEQVVSDFRMDRDGVARQLLHVTLHCLLGHLELRDGFDSAKGFDTAADLKVAQLAGGLCGDDFAIDSRQLPRYCWVSIHNIRPLPPLYQILTSACDTHEKVRLRQTAMGAAFDDHDLWSPVLAAAEELKVSPDGHCDPSREGPPGDEAPGSEADRGDGGDTRSGEAEGNGIGSPDWDRIRRSMLEGSGSKLPGNCAGLLNENFSVSDPGMSFAGFLKRFAAPEERILLDPDSFDLRWYHLGLEYYGDLPLLEPSELSEPPVPDDIVIALDTSGSCSGEICRRFLKETLSILRDISAGSARFRVLLLQCDTRIRDEVLLENADQVDELFRNFEARGFGGTDFCPVFERVEKLRQSGMLPRVRGLLYLSDGYGTFPDQPPDYPTVFLIPDEDQSYVPRGTEWVTRLYLNETDYTLKEANAI